ncbi:MAG: YadA-like family protein, partial [Coraliomargaritaceae bacterium]
FTVNGDSFLDNTTVDGTLAVTGDASFAANASITGNLDVDGILSVGTYSNVENTLNSLEEDIQLETQARIQADSLLSDRIDHNASQIDENRKGIAMVAAMTHTTLLPGKTQALDLGVASFEGETAFSVNFAKRVDDGVQINVSAAKSGKVSAFKGSVGWQW